MRTVTFCRVLTLCIIFLFSRGYGTMIPDNAKCHRGGCYEGVAIDIDYSLLVFISFSMPDASLLSFAAELEAYGGAFVIRGLPNNSFAEFSQQLNHLKDLGIDASILIDPDSFEEYEVGSVPTVVLREERAFDKISGNVPISYALETFAGKGDLRALAKDLQSGSSNPRNLTRQSHQIGGGSQ